MVSGELASSSRFFFLFLFLKVGSRARRSAHPVEAWKQRDVCRANSFSEGTVSASRVGGKRGRPRNLMEPVNTCNSTSVVDHTAGLVNMFMIMSPQWKTPS